MIQSADLTRSDAQVISNYLDVEEPASGAEGEAPPS